MNPAEGVALFILASVATAIESLVRYASFRGRIRWGIRCWLHLLVNGLAAVGLLALLRALGLEAAGDSQVTQRTAQVAGAGLGALAILRTATFARRIEADADLPEELSGVAGVVESARHLLAFLVARADQEMRDRFDSYLTATATPLLTGWTYQDHGSHIGAMCGQLATLEEVDRAVFTKKLKEINKISLPDQSKALLLIRQCVRFGNEDSVRAAINAVVS